MASISSSVWGSCPGKPYWYGARYTYEAKLKSQWNRFLDDIGVIGVIRQFDYDAFLTLEELLVNLIILVIQMMVGQEIKMVN